MDILQYINKMNRLYGNDTQVASSDPLGFPEHMIHQYEGGQLTPEEFYQHQSIPQSERPLTGAEGGRVYNTRKYLQGGRVGLKPGGLVEPGVMNYAVKEPITHKKFEELYSKFKNNPDYLGTDKEFAKILNKKYKPKVSDKYTSQIVSHTRNQLNIKGIEKHSGAPGNIKKKLDKAAKLETLIANANAQDKFITKKFIAEKAGIESGFDTYANIFKTLDGPTEKVDNILRDLLMDDKPLDDRLVEVIKKRVGLKQTKDVTKHLRLTPTFKTIGPVGGDLLIKATNMSNYEGLNLSQQLEKALDVQLGQPTYTGVKGLKMRFVSPANATMNYAKESWNRSKGKGVIQFFDSKGKPIVWEHGLKLPINDVSFKYKNKLHKYKDLHNSTYMKQYFPELQEKIIAANKFKASKVDNPFKPGEKISVRKLVKKIQVDGYQWQPRTSTVDILHGSKGVADEPFTNLRYNTKDINQAELGLSKSLKAGNITQAQYNQSFKKLNKSFKGLTGGDYEKAIVDRITTQAEKIKQGKFYNYNVLIDNLSDFCTKGKQKVALGGRIGFSGTCTPEEILENMKKDQQLLIEYKQGSKNISSAEAAKIAQKFTNASGKILKLGARGARFMFGPALLWGEPLFEGAFVAHDMMGNKTPFKEAVSKTYFSKPLRAMGLMKEPEEYEAEALYLKKDGTGVIPGVKAYTDARNKLMRINDLRSKISNMEEEVESGVTLGAADALESLQKQLFKEMSDIRYNEKSLHNTMKKNEQQYNIAVERQRAERFEGVDPYEAQKFDPTLIGTGRDKRAEEMAKVNIGRDQDIYGRGPVDQETYNLWSEVASVPGEYQAQAKNLVKMVDQLGGPGFAPYKKILATGVTGPANRYTLGQVTTPADRYHWDKIGKLAELGGFSYEKAFGGRVPFKTGGMSRRRFLEVIGALVGGTAAFKTGLLKIIKGSTGKTALKAGDKIIQGTPGMPEWFPALVNRIVKEGDDVTAKLATTEREIVHSKKISEGEEVTVYQDMNTGNVRVEYNSPDIMGEGAVGPVQLEYRAGEVIDSGKMKGQKTKPEFEAAEAEPVGHTHGPDDYSIEWDGENIVGRVEDLMSDTSNLKQFATKKKPTIKEIVESSKKKKSVQKVHENESDYIVSKQGEAEWDDYLPDIDDIE